MEADEYLSASDLVAACHKAGFTSTHRGLGRNRLWKILTGEETPPPPRVDSLLQKHREGMEKIIARYGDRILNQLGCSGVCSECPDAQSAECAAHNADKTTGR